MDLATILVSGGVGTTLGLIGKLVYDGIKAGKNGKESPSPGTEVMLNHIHEDVKELKTGTDKNFSEAFTKLDRMGERVGNNEGNIKVLHSRVSALEKKN